MDCAGIPVGRIGWARQVLRCYLVDPKYNETEFIETSLFFTMDYHEWKPARWLGAIKRTFGIYRYTNAFSSQDYWSYWKDITENDVKAWLPGSLENMHLNALIYEHSKYTWFSLIRHCTACAISYAKLATCWQQQENSSWSRSLKLRAENQITDSEIDNMDSNNASNWLCLNWSTIL